MPAEQEHTQGTPPSPERIHTAHSALPPTTYNAESHFEYKQGHDERCYICTLLSELQAAQEREQKLRAELKRVSNRAFQWKDAYEARLAAFKLLAAQRTEEPSE